MQMKKHYSCGPDGILSIKNLQVWWRESSKQTIETNMQDKQIPSDLRNANKIKKKNYIRLWELPRYCLLSIAGKILALVPINRLLPLSEDLLPESQCGFRTFRSTTDMIFVARQIQEKCQQQNKDLFIDSAKAFESINREALWKVLSRFDCPANFITILRLVTATVLINGTET